MTEDPLMTPEATGPESLREADSLAMALGRLEVDLGRFKLSGQIIGRPYADCDADLATIKAALLPPTVQEDAGLGAAIAWLEKFRVHPSRRAPDNAHIDRIILAIARSGSGGTGAPEGWVLVPKEPTEAMKVAAFGPIRQGGRNGPVTSDFIRQEAALSVYRMMIEAAPPPAGAGK